MSNVSPREFLELLKSSFEKIENTEYAEAQRKYMRGQYEYYGIKAKPRQDIIKNLMRQEGVFHGEELTEFCEICYGEPTRDLHYSALQMTEKVIKKQKEDFIKTLEFMIIENSWWDTVDWLAKIVGMHFKRFPHLIKPYTEGWIESENMWLQRVAIIFQLFYKQDTNTEMLFDYIRRHSDSKEFFIQKAMGWALRQHSRTDAKLVRTFIESEELPKLTVKEGLRLMKG